MTMGTLPRWAVMWGMAFGIYVVCKWLTWWRTSRAGCSVGRQLGYLVAWPGLDAVAFLGPRSEAKRPTLGEWSFAVVKLAFGGWLCFVVAERVPAEHVYWRGWVGMLGIVMGLHFGLFDLLSCAWRSQGVTAGRLMECPVVSTSVSEFWGRRWNVAFRDLTHRFLFRPWTARFGPRSAMGVGFVFSGLVHDVVISVPAGGGYGRPTLFFLLQGVAMFFERSRVGRSLGLGRGWCGWLFTLVVLLGPVGLLFHRPFVVEVVVPFLEAMGAVS